MHRSLDALPSPRHTSSSVRRSAARRALVGLFAGAAFVTTACQQPEPAAPPPAARHESAALGIALASIPGTFDLQSSDESGVSLAGPDGGDLLIEVGPADAGVNLIAESQARIDHFGSLEGGQSFGSRELQAPIGSAYTVRGRYPGDAGELEETWVYAYHPADRLISLRYRYPAGEDTEARIGQLMEALGEVEILGSGSD